MKTALVLTSLALFQTSMLEAATEASVSIVSPDPLECPLLSSAEKISARCRLGSLRIHLPQGQRLTELSLAAEFETELKALGDLAGVVLRVKTRKKTYSASSYVKIEDLDRDPLPVNEVKVSLELPPISACDKDLDLDLPLQASYSVNFVQGSSEVPPLKFKSVSILSKKFETITCPRQGDAP